jgi:hypothetical protein
MKMPTDIVVGKLHPILTPAQLELHQILLLARPLVLHPMPMLA